MSRPEFTGTAVTIASQGESEPHRTTSSGEDADTLARSVPNKEHPSAEEELRYEDLGKIGHGGMGTVRQVLDRTLLRSVAMKLLRQNKTPEYVRRFCKEAQITGQLDHPNIPPIYELAQSEAGHHYFCMKLVEGRTLEEYVADLGEKRFHPTHLTKIIGIFVKVCEALAFAHSRGVVHRDIKPSNIMIGEYGQVYLMDWGVAHLLPQTHPAVHPERRVRVDLNLENEEQFGAVIGTPRYMAPEQAEGQHNHLGPASDVFSLGASLYHVLAGHPPYREETYLKVLIAAISAKYVPLQEAVEGGGLPDSLVEIVEKAMQLKTEDRYASMTSMQEALETFRHGSWSLPTRRYSAGEKIVCQGDEGHLAFVITRGDCVVIDESAGRRELRHLGKGDVFGETAVFSSNRRTATVEAVTEVTVAVVEREALSTGLGLDSWMGSFVRALAERFADVDQRLRKIEGEHG